MKMKVTTKRLLVLLVTFAMLAISACAEKEKDTGSDDGAKEEKTTYKVGVTSQTLQIEAYQLMSESAEEWFEDNAPEVEFLWQACDYEPGKQINQVETFIAEGYDVIVIEPVMPETGDTLIKLCKDAGVPCIVSETRAATELSDYYIVADSYKVGEMEVEYFIEQWGTDKPANAVILSGTSGDYVAEEITRGYLETLEKYNNINVVMHQWCKDWEPTIAMGHMENALSSNGNKIDVVFANNDQMVNAAITASKNAGVEDKIWFIASDFDRETVPHYYEGLQLGIVDKGQKDQGAYIAEAAYSLIKGTEFKTDGVLDDGQPVTYMPITMVTKENVAEMAKYKFDMDPPKE